MVYLGAAQKPPRSSCADVAQTLRRRCADLALNQINSKSIHVSIDYVFR